jgi:hypothetical protein
LDRKKSVRKLKMRLVHGTKESRYMNTHIPHDEEGRHAMLLMDLNKLDQDLDSTASSSSDSEDSDGDDAGCESCESRRQCRFTASCLSSFVAAAGSACNAMLTVVPIVHLSCIDIMGVIARKGSFWTCRTAGQTAAGRSVVEVGSNPENIAPVLFGLQPTWNETQFRNVHVQVR